MSVSGGGSGWTCVGSVAVLLGVVGLVGTAGCGSRTSTLDPDAYATQGQGGSSNVKPGGAAGKATTGGGLLGTAGGTSVPPSVSSGVNTALAKGPCDRYCAGYGTQCKKKLEGKDCLTTCQGELNGYGPFCQSLGIDTLTCLTPFFSANGGDCGTAVGRALNQCGDTIATFDDCKSEFATGTQNPISKCPRSGDGGTSTSCTSIFECASGPYVTFCSPTESMKFAECGCVPPTGSSKNARVPVGADLCFNATVLCQ